MSKANGALHDAQDLDLEDENAITAMRAIVAEGKKGKGSGYKARKKAEKKIRATISGASLAETGRTKQFNVKVLPSVHRAAMDAAADEGITVSEWMEKLISQHLGLEVL